MALDATRIVERSKFAEDRNVRAPAAGTLHRIRICPVILRPSNQCWGQDLFLLKRMCGTNLAGFLGCASLFHSFINPTINQIPGTHYIVSWSARYHPIRGV